MSVTLQITKSNVAVLVLSRPEKRNAFNSDVIHELIQCIEHANTLDIRALVLKTEGKHFSAGADLAWMKSMADNNYNDNLADSMQLAKLMQVLAQSPHPTICAVQGAAFGGEKGILSGVFIIFGQQSFPFVSVNTFKKNKTPAFFQISKQSAFTASNVSRDAYYHFSCLPPAEHWNRIDFK